MRGGEGYFPAKSPRPHPLLLLHECCELLDKIEIDFTLPREPIRLQDAAQAAGPLRVIPMRLEGEMADGAMTFRHSV